MAQSLQGLAGRAGESASAVAGAVSLLIGFLNISTASSLKPLAYTYGPAPHARAENPLVDLTSYKAAERIMAGNHPIQIHPVSTLKINFSIM